MLFRDIDFGSDDAKGDIRLSEYFVRSPEYERVRSGDAAFVIGRKGTGKTAICQIIHEEAQRSANLFSILLSFKNAPSSALFASSDTSFNAPNQYVSIWRFLIVLETAKLILRDESVDGTIRAELEQFLLQNFGNVSIACLDAVSVLKDKQWKVGLTLPVHGLPGGEISRRLSDGATQEIHYGRAAAALIEYLGKIQTENRFFLLFDELDEDYGANKNYFDLIISLLKACYQLRREQFGTLAVHPIVVLREDIYSKLDDHDLNKIEDLTVHLSWRGEPKETGSSLRGLINERVRAHAIHLEKKDPWLEIVDEAAWGSPYSSAWEFFVKRTMDRPRDLIKALKCCQRFESREKLSTSAVSESLGDYSKWLYREIGNEMFRAFPDYRDALGLLQGLPVPGFDATMWKTRFGNNPKLRGKYNAENVLELLHEYNVVGMVMGKKLRSAVFRYNNPQILFDINRQFVVHEGLRKHLAIASSIPVSKPLQATSKVEVSHKPRSRG
jgi:hypothetical protein